MSVFTVSPIAKDAKFLRVDQGVDYVQSESDPFVAPAPGTITKVSPRGSWAGGTGAAIYETFDTPVTVASKNGVRRYTGVYIAETTPLLETGKHVAAGTPLATGGSAELGFAIGNEPAISTAAAGGLGAATKPTVPGNDFLASLTGAPSAPAATPSGGGGFLGVATKVGETVASVGTLGGANALGLPGGYIPSIPNPFNFATKWVSDLTTWLAHEAAIGFLYAVLTIAALGLLFMSVRRTASATAAVS